MPMRKNYFFFFAFAFFFVFFAMMPLLCCKVEHLLVADSHEDAWRFLSITHQQMTLGVLATRPWERKCIGCLGVLP